MEHMSYAKSLEFLRRLKEDHLTLETCKKNDTNLFDIYPSDLSRGTDIRGLYCDRFWLYDGTDAEIKRFLLSNSYIEANGKITDKGNIFLKKFSGVRGWCEAWLTDYPLFFQSLLSIIAIITSVIAIFISIIALFK